MAALFVYPWAKIGELTLSYHKYCVVQSVYNIETVRTQGLVSPPVNLPAHTQETKKG